MSYANYTQYIKHSQEIKYVTLTIIIDRGGVYLISYKPFFETLFRKNITEYELIFKHGISANTIHRMKKGEAITTKTIDTLCFILDCSISDIIEHDNTR